MARSRRRRTTTERAAGLIALALPAPVQRVADTPLGSLLMLVGIPAMLVFGCLNVKFVDGFPTLSLNGQKAAELQRVASQQLSEIEHQVVNQNWGAATDLLRAAQNANPSYYANNTSQPQPQNAAYLAQLQQYQWQQQQQQQQQQQLMQRQAYQQSLMSHQNQYPYGQVNNQQTPYPQQQQPYSNPGYQSQTYQPQSYPQQNFQGYQQPNVQPNYQQSVNQGQTAYHPTNQPTNQIGYGTYGQVPAQPTGYPIPVNQNNRIPLPSTTNSSQRQYVQPGSLLR